MPAGPFVSCFGPLGFWVNRRVLRNEIKDKVEPFDLRKYVLYATCRFREIHRNINTTIAQLPAAGPALEYDQHERISEYHPAARKVALDLRYGRQGFPRWPKTTRLNRRLNRQ